MTTSTTIEFDAAQCRGNRAAVGTVGVDSGTMTITTAFNGDTNDILDRLHRDYTHGNGYVACTTAYGDGGYDVVTVTSDDAVVGLEVLFASPVVDETTEKRTAHLTRLTGEELRAAQAGDETQRKRHNEYFTAVQKIFTEVWDELLASLDPEQDKLTPQVITSLDVDGAVGVGDPCYGSTSLNVDLPAGRYVAVAWLLPMGQVARLALYRQR